MPTNDFLPSTDEGLRAFAVNFARQITANAAAFDLVAEVEPYQALVDTYAARLQAATDNDTRGKKTIFLKNESKNQVVALTRKYAKQIRGLVGVTDEQLLDLGLTVPSDERRRIPRPTVAPMVKVFRGEGRRIVVELLQSKTRRAKPADVAGATIFTHLGSIAPATMSEWQYGEQVTRTRVELDFPPSETGDTAWVSAFWTNAKGESGPSSTPVSINLPAGGALPQEMEDQAPAPLRVAA